jgi:hypothetical protein
LPVEVYANLPQTTVSTGGTTAPAAGTVETWTVASSSSFPPASGSSTPTAHCHVSDPAAASELIDVTDITGTTWTVTRGAEGTTPVAHTAGFTVKQAVTAGALGLIGNGSAVWSAPYAAQAETFPRILATGANALVSGTLAVTAIGLPQYLTISAIAMSTKGTAKTGGTHGWYVLLDNTLKVRAVTADQTDAATVWGATNTVYQLATNTYTTAYTGLYYLGVMVAASGMPNIASAGAGVAGIVSAVPILAGTSSTGQTTPPSAGTTMGALASANSNTYYGYVG